MKTATKFRLATAVLAMTAVSTFFGLKASGLTIECGEYGLGGWNVSTVECDCYANAYSVNNGPDLYGPCVCDNGFLRTPAAVNNQCIPSPAGVYILNKHDDGTQTDAAYCPPATQLPTCVFADAATYVNSITGHAIFLPIAQILPDAGGIADWNDAASWQGQFDFSYLDNLASMAVSNGKTFSIALVVGLQGGQNYLSSLPANFETKCNPSGDAATTCAPLFPWWKNNPSPGSCSYAYVPLPWNPNVQQFWIQLANQLASWLQTHPNTTSPYYNSLRMIHLPGLSLYSEEMRLPTAELPATAPSDASDVMCPLDPTGDAGLAKDLINGTAYQNAYAAYGYGSTWDSGSIVSGITTIASAFAQAFPDRVIAISLFDPGVAKNLDYPNFIDDAGIGNFAQQVTGSIVDGAVPPSRLLIQADDLGSAALADSGFVQPEVISFVSEYGSGWQYVLEGWQRARGPHTSRHFRPTPSTTPTCRASRSRPRTTETPSLREPCKPSSRRRSASTPRRRDAGNTRSTNDHRLPLFL